MKKANADVFVNVDGGNVRIAGGEEYPDDHPLVAAYPAMFDDVEPPAKKLGRPVGSKNKPKPDDE